MTRRRRTARDKVVEAIRVLHELRTPRRQGARIVFTNGCFDVLHVGHLRLLEAAAAEGDLLVVGLNGDRSLRRLKGRQRPLVPLAERALLLAGLEAVDWVVAFEEDTPLRLIDLLRPDVLVKGADWPVERIVGRSLVEARGGRVVTVPLVAGRSTTRLVQRLRQRDRDGGAGLPHGASAVID